MSEKIVIRQDREFNTVFLAADPGKPDSEKLSEVARYCPIYKILTNGIRVESRLAES